MPASHLRVLVPAALALALLAGGCGKITQPLTGPRGDNGGEHLLVFATDRPGGPGGFDIALYDIDAVGYRSLANLNSASTESEPCISNDGQLIACASDRTGGQGGFDVVVYDRLNAATLDERPMNSAANETSPRFTYDSSRLAFVRDSLTWKRVRLYEPVGDTLIALPGMTSNGAFHDDAPAPDLHGNRIAFQSSRAGANHVYVWDRATGLQVLGALVSDSLDEQPALSGDGRWLAFSSNRSGGAGGWDVYLYDLVNHAIVPLPRANTAGDERHPTVSASGYTLCFQSRPTSADAWEVWRYARDDSSRTQPALLPSTAQDIQPYLRYR